MNYQQTLDEMLNAAAGAARGHWTALRDYAEIEFKRLSEAALGLEADYVSDMVAAQLELDSAARAEAERRAKRRTELAFDSLKLAAEGVVIAATADAKIAAQDAVNAALTVLRGAINTSIGIALL
jgi:zona occludens toxin (predicted ATPase)